MKFRVTLKDPDGIYTSIDEAASDEARRIIELAGTDVLDFDDLKDKVHDKINKEVGAFFEYGDYVYLDVDTEARTVVVGKAR